MCGRFTHLYTWRQLHDLMSLAMTAPLDFQPSYNVAPTQSAPVVRADGSGRRVDLLRWGLVPFWAKDFSMGGGLANARAETVATKPTFREAFKSRRCLVPISGFYEWQKSGSDKSKQPHYIYSASGEPLVLAGLWDHCKLDSGEELTSFAVLTTTPNEMMGKLHDRMPVILSESAFAPWLDAKTPVDALSAYMVPFASERMSSHPVATLVNSPRNNRPACIAPVQVQPAPQQQQLWGA